MGLLLRQGDRFRNYLFQIYQPNRILDEIRGRGLESECAGAVSTARLSLATRFAPPKTEEETEKARIESIPIKTREDTAYCV